MHSDLVHSQCSTKEGFKCIKSRRFFLGLFLSCSLIPLLKMIQEVYRSDERLQLGVCVKYGSSYADIQGKGTI